MNRHEYLCAITRVVASKSTCPRARVGAVFTSPDGEILATGYNGAPRGMDHCDDVGCLVVDGHCVRSTHAEQNAIVQAAKRGTALRGSTLYVTHTPCAVCVKLLINLGVEKVVSGEPYGLENPLTARWWARLPLVSWDEALNIPSSNI